MDISATLKWLRCAATAAYVVAVSQVAYGVEVATPEPLQTFSIQTSLRETHFPEPIVPTAPTSTLEDAALSEALAAYGRRTLPDDVSSLTSYLGRFPHSGWSAGLQTNIGISDLHYGYFSGALVAWQRAWTEGKNATEPRGRALVDGAVGRLAWLEASLGHFKELEALFDEIGSRKISGSATETLQAAREELTLAQSHPKHLLLCGPVALGSLMLEAGARHDQVRFVHTYSAGPNGTSLAEVARLADQSGFSHRLIFRQTGQSVPVPSIIHWKVGHFAAIVGQANGRFEVEDPIFPEERTWVTPQALDAEASGYFLVSASAKPDSKWRTVEEAEAGTVWGKGPTGSTRPGGAGDPSAGAPGGGCPLCGYNIAESAVALTLLDTPVGYSPPIGPSAKVSISYNQREASQPQNFSFFNVSPKWTLNWLSYVTDDPTNLGGSVSRYLAGGGAFYYSGFNSSTGRFAAQDTDGSSLVLTSQSPISYQRQLADGSIEIYAQSDGSLSYPRNIFLSKIVDPQGNALTLNYDNQHRLVSLTDAVGRQTIFTYGQSRPLLITSITDPFGRSATLGYDVNGRLTSITDVIGLTSRFTYDANSLVNSLTTPYGTTSFAYTAPGASGPPRYVQVTDPLGYNEREEWLEPSSTPSSDPAATVPQGMPISLTNDYLQYRNSFHWDKDAYVLAGCTPSGGCDYTKARITHFVHMPPNTNIKGTGIESIKYPLENRIWNTYPGQTSSLYGGTYNSPNATARVLDDGSTQISQFTLDTSGFYKKLQEIDPLGRTTSYSYPNHIDLAAITQSTAAGTTTTIAQFIYNAQHRPIFYADAGNQTTAYAYNAAGQITSVTNSLSQTTKYQYDSVNNISSIINANNATAATFTYDAFDRIATYTDSEGWTAAYSYDNADRVTKVTFPDGTSDNYTYSNLDLASYQDRLGRIWAYSHDANRRMTGITDPLGNHTLYGYNGLDELTSLTDPNNNTTTWVYDIEGRLTSKQYADGSVVSYAYENTTSRLKSVTDALGQTKQYAYAEDNRPTSVTYLNATNSTPNVTFAYDPYFPRTTSMTDGNGTTLYSYVPVGMPGALRLQQEASPLPNSAIAYAYDFLGRLASRTIAQSGAETYQYDAIGRLVGDANDLGSFTLSYLGQTRQITQRQLAGSTLSTSWSYLPNTGDRRLAAVDNVGLSSSQYSNFQFTTVPENLITSITETSDSPSAYPGPLTQTASFNNLNQLTNLSGQPLTYDANGNLLSDGQRTYSWDAENRLVGILYPNQAGKTTSFAYDGLGRRTAITSTAAGVSIAAASYLWCGPRICQSRDKTNTAMRSYYTEGEYVFGPSQQSLYYGIDQIDSVRRVFASSSNAPAYPRGPYGEALSTPSHLTDFGFANMFYNTDSDLYLTLYRDYSPNVGRWLSRDQIQEEPNLYPYVKGNPLGYVDPWGLDDVPPPTDSGGSPLPPPTSPPPGKNGQPNSWVPCPPSGSGSRPGKWKPKYPVTSPNGGQPGASWDPDGHWDIDDGQGDRQRVDPNGNPVDHGNPAPEPTTSNRSPPSLPPWTYMIPFIPFPGNPLYGGF